jgi:ribosomal-protein-alanine N-acetyltransferase
LTKKKQNRDYWPDVDPEPPVDGVEIVPMEIKHLDEVVKIERVSFLTPWSRSAFEFDLNENNLARYWVLLKNGKIIGYSGIWLVGRIAHVTTICIVKKWRGKNLGEWLLLKTMSMGAEEGARRYTLEVRETNEEAIRLYEKVGYHTVGRRPNYYQEIGEDALVMWTGEPPYEG